MASLKSSKASQEKAPAHTPRPPNAFLCFRSRFIREMKAFQTSNSGPMMRDISKQAADVWNSMDDEDRQPYFEQAYRMRDEHKAAYPDYKYTPSK
ncbi:high mobility group box domain-containing protein, partial [Mycena polygramma]